MKYTSPSRMRSVVEFRERLLAVDPELGCDDEILGAGGALGQALEVDGRTLANRFAIHPMEGWDGTPEGLPSADTLRRWRHFGASGAKLIWGGEAFAVQEDGRANPRQLYLNPRADVAGGLAALRAELRGAHRDSGEEPDSLYLGLQLTHSGRFSRPTEAGPAPRIAYHHPVLDPRFGVEAGVEPLTDGELEAIGENYVRAARLAREAGFHFVDLKCCHGYLMHELLGARARPGPYGGSFENRVRLFRRILGAVRAECPSLGIAVRVSIADVFPHSRDPDTGVGAARGWEEYAPLRHGFGVDADDPRRFDLEEPLRFLALLQDLGVRLVNLTLGSPYYCPHLQRPAAYPPSDGYAPPEDPLASVARHLRVVRRCKRAFPELVLVGTGYSYLQEYLPHVAQHEVRAGHVDLVGLGRMVLSYPELPRDVLRHRRLDRRRLCRTFSDCTTAPRNGLPSGCYPLDAHYRERPEADRLKQLKRAARAQ